MDRVQAVKHFKWFIYQVTIPQKTSESHSSDVANLSAKESLSLNISNAYSRRLLFVMQHL